MNTLSIHLSYVESKFLTFKTTIKGCNKSLGLLLIIHTFNIYKFFNALIFHVICNKIYVFLFDRQTFFYKSLITQHLGRIQFIRATMKAIIITIFIICSLFNSTFSAAKNSTTAGMTFMLYSIK